MRVHLPLLPLDGCPLPYPPSWAFRVYGPSVPPPLPAIVWYQCFPVWIELDLILRSRCACVLCDHHGRYVVVGLQLFAWWLGFAG
jgi:hypothetical protein